MNAPSPMISGKTSPRFAAVREAFDRSFADGLELGAALAVVAASQAHSGSRRTTAGKDRAGEVVRGMVGRSWCPAPGGWRAGRRHPDGVGGGV